jgi:hypothetical protein
VVIMGVLRLPLLIAIALAVAFGGGIWTSVVALRATTTLGAIQIGPWVATPLAQTADADPYSKARRAQSPSLPLGQAEGLVFRARNDSNGDRLMATCEYRVTGHTPPSRMWTLRLAHATQSGTNGDPRFPTALHSNALVRSGSGDFIVTLAPTIRAGNWLHL